MIMSDQIIDVDDMDALRQRIRSAMKERGLAMTDVARQVGVPYGTFSSWMGNTYRGRLGPIGEKASQWLDGQQAADRTRALAPKAPGFLPTPTAEAILATLEHAQFMPEFVVITGSPGVGKTSAGRAYAQRNTNVWLITAEPTMSTPRAVLEYLAEAIGVPSRGMSTQQLSRSLTRRMTGSQGLILIDEAQHLTSQTLDQLRMFYDLADIGMRLARPRAMKGDIEQLMDAWDIAGKEERAMLVQIAKRPGALRNLTKVLRMAHMLGSAEGAEAVAETHISMAWERLSAGAPLMAENA
jgi:DNA transposition AAA+ family ATPase